jgi:hypothetical protein
MTLNLKCPCCGYTETVHDERSAWVVCPKCQTIRSGSVQPDCSAVLSALDTLCRKAEQDEYFRIWKDYPLGCGPLTTSIAREAGMSLQTTRRHLIKLEWAGYVNAKRTSGGTTRWWCPPNAALCHPADGDGGAQKELSK